MQFLKRLKDQKGFTIIEAIMSMMVLSIGLWGTMAIFQNVTQHSLSNDFKIIASQLATEQLENIISDKTFTGYDTVTDNEYTAQSLPAPYSSYKKNVIISEVDPQDMKTILPGSGYKRVDVTVSWGPNTYEAVSVSTVLANYSS